MYIYITKRIFFDFYPFHDAEKKRNTSIIQNQETSTANDTQLVSIWQSFSQWECHTEGHGQTSMAIQSTISMPVVYMSESNISLVENLKNFSVCSMKTKEYHKWLLLLWKDRYTRYSSINKTYFTSTTYWQPYASQHIKVAQKDRLINRQIREKWSLCVGLSMQVTQKWCERHKKGCPCNK